MSKKNIIKQQLIEFLNGELAHMNLVSAVKDFPEKDHNTKPPNVDYSFWHILEHIRITQNDILDFIKNSNYQEMEWPKDYWPGKNEKATKKEWEKTIKEYHKDVEELKKIVNDPETDLFAKIPWGDGQTIFREIVLVIDHNAYHIGEFGILRQIAGNWS